MRFSEYYKVKRKMEDDWFDPILEYDTSLFIDPSLTINNNLKFFSEAKTKINNFFQIAFEHVAKLKKSNKILNAIPLLRFKEPKELHLGYTNYGSGGGGLGDFFSKKIIHAIVDFLNWGMGDFEEYVEAFQFLVEGIGPDRISDMLANILKEDLIKYTQKICKKHNIPLKKFLIQNAFFDEKTFWEPRKVKLPMNPLSKKAIILVPEDFLRANDELDIPDFEQYLLNIENEELRSKASKLFVGKINRTKILEAMNSEPEIVKQILHSYFEYVKQKGISPYDFRNDPDLLYWFNQEIDLIKKAIKDESSPQSIKRINKNKEELINFVEMVIDKFKFIVEKRENYRLLFNDDGTPKGEKAAQHLFWGVAEIYSEIYNKVVSPECPTGRGPVDFKFNEGYHNKVHVELKHLMSSKRYSGLEKQLPLYVESDEVDFAYYVAIELVGEDNVRKIKLFDRYKKLDKKIKDKIKIKHVDAFYDKPSASKI